MTFRYVNKIQLGNDFQIRPENSTLRCLLDTKTKFDQEMTFRYVNKIQLGDDFQIRKSNPTWKCH